MDESRSYELAYLLSPAIGEEGVLAYSQKLSSLIEDQKGVVKHAEQPRKRKLAYPVKKERDAYFGWTTFQLTPSTVTALDKKIKMEDQLLRHMIMEEDAEAQLPVFRSFGGIRPSSSAPIEQTIPREAEQKDEQLDLEALDKKLEEILGK